MSSDVLGDRRKAMEEAFFVRENEALRQRLRATDDTRRNKEALSAASAITHDAVLENPAALNIHSEMLAALSLIPLVAVAWAPSMTRSGARSFPVPPSWGWARAMSARSSSSGG